MGVRFNDTSLRFWIGWHAWLRSLRVRTEQCERAATSRSAACRPSPRTERWMKVRSSPPTRMGAGTSSASSCCVRRVVHGERLAPSCMAGLPARDLGGDSGRAGRGSTSRGTGRSPSTPSAVRSGRGERTADRARSTRPAVDDAEKDRNPQGDSVRAPRTSPRSPLTAARPAPRVPWVRDLKRRGLCDMLYSCTHRHANFRLCVVVVPPVVIPATDTVVEPCDPPLGPPLCWGLFFCRLRLNDDDHPAVSDIGCAVVRP